MNSLASKSEKKECTTHNKYREDNTVDLLAGIIRAAILTVRFLPTLVYSITGDERTPRITFLPRI